MRGEGRWPGRRTPLAPPLRYGRLAASEGRYGGPAGRTTHTSLTHPVPAGPLPSARGGHLPEVPN